MRALSLANLSSPRRAAAPKTPRGAAHSVPKPAGGTVHGDGSFVCAHGVRSYVKDKPDTAGQRGPRGRLEAEAVRT